LNIVHPSGLARLLHPKVVFDFLYEAAFQEDSHALKPLGL
jgi:hypothetical protein